MGRLIDTDELMERLCFENTQEERDMNCGEVITLNDIDDIPTAYDVDKVVEQLKEEKHNRFLYDDELEIRKTAIDDAIEIVKRGGIDE